MSLTEEREIFIKRKKIQEEGHHGGAWKVAYADFVTAMMAFFIIVAVKCNHNRSKARNL